MMKDHLIRALLPHVAFDGWGEKALTAAARDCGCSLLEAEIHVPAHAAAQVDLWLQTVDADMTASLATAGLAQMKVRDRIATAIRMRLEMVEPHREAVRRAATLLALPHNMLLSLRSLARTSDAIWRAAGDTATDFNHYTKRATLGAVYAATLLVWLQDDSDNRADTWAFLDRRLDGVMRFEKFKGEVRRNQAKLPSLTRFLGRLRYPAT